MIELLVLKSRSGSGQLYPYLWWNGTFSFCTNNIARKPRRYWIDCDESSVKNLEPFLRKLEGFPSSPTYGVASALLPTVDIPWVTDFPLVTHVFSENENFQDSNPFFAWTVDVFQFFFQKVIKLMNRLHLHLELIT